MAYQSSIHCLTKYSPTYVVLGFPLSLPIDCIYSTPQTAIYATPSDYNYSTKHKLQETHQLMRESVNVEQECQKTYYDRSKYGPNYKVNLTSDKVENETKESEQETFKGQEKANKVAGGRGESSSEPKEKARRKSEQKFRKRKKATGRE